MNSEYDKIFNSKFISPKEPLEDKQFILNSTEQFLLDA